MWVGSGNNYAYLIECPETREAAIVDPAEPSSVLPVLKHAKASGTKLTRIITTHHHQDHAGGNAEILKHYPELEVVGSRQADKVQKTPADGEKFKIGSSIEVTAIHTPCHTQDSICFRAESSCEKASKAVFTGDTLFIAGCGRFFEGSAKEMDTALNTKLATLSDETLVYPGHEYTKANATFALQVMPKSTALQKLVEFCKSNRETCGRFTIADEKLHNPFMRLEDAEILENIGLAGSQNREAIMAKLREMKNNS
ncbi:Cytoplasmic glyoxalase II [Savitreella phatthalungensis]